MFSQDPAVEAAGVDPQFFSHQKPEACRVQVGATADDAVFGEATQFPGDIGQNIHCWEKYHLLKKNTRSLCDKHKTERTEPGLETTMMMQSGLYRTI